MATLSGYSWKLLIGLRPATSTLLIRKHSYNYFSIAKQYGVNNCKMCGNSILNVSSVHTSATSNRSADIDKDVTDSLLKIRNKDFDNTKVTNPEDLQHFRKPTKVKEMKKQNGDMLNAMAEGPGEELPMGASTLPHPIWSDDELHNVEITHKKPVGFIDNLAYYTVQLLRKSFDLFSGFNRTSVRGEKVWINRIVFLETVAGVPGMVAAMVRHLHSLRRMRRDHGWIHTLLEEAENERMHLMTALQVKQPGPIFRGAVVLAQGCMVTYFSLAYLVSPKYCHRFVGYLEEEAVKTYSKCLEDIEYGHLHHWKKKEAPEVSKLYWKLHDEATMKDVILAIRADEAHHRVVNHTLASLKPDDYNPYRPGQ